MPHARENVLRKIRRQLVEAVWGLIREGDLTVNETHHLLADVAVEFTEEAVAAERLEAERVRRPVRRKRER